jgi:drug/metabolite transporter (DMT)-like permease
MSRKRKLAYLVLGINTVVWGLAAAAVKPALTFISPEKFLFYRFLIASWLCAPVLVWTFRSRKWQPKELLKVVGLELVGTTLILWMIYRALSLTSALETSLIYATSPLFVTLAGIIFLKERETKREWRGLAVALAGTALITAEPLLSGQKIEGGSATGNILILIQNLIWAGYLVAAKKVYRKLPKLGVTAISFLVGTVTFFLLSLPQGNPLAAVAADWQIPAVQLAIWYMAIFGSIIGATTYLVGQNLIEVSEATVFTYAQAVVAVPAAMLLLGERLSPAAVIGIAVVAIGVYLTEKRR